MAFPIINFNNSSGSDTAASGSGPATAIVLSGAAHTNGVSSTTITLTGSPDLSSLVTFLGSGGFNGAATHALGWFKTSSGRQFTKITAANNTTKEVTVENALNIASGSPVDFVCGGKRATLDSTESRKLFSDIYASLAGTNGGVWQCPCWQIYLENTGSNYLITSTISCGGQFRLSGPYLNPPTIEMTANAVIFTGASIHGTHIRVINTNASKTSAYFTTTGWNRFEFCIFGSFTASQRLERVVSADITLNVFYHCDFLNVTYGLYQRRGSQEFYNCYCYKSTPAVCWDQNGYTVIDQCLIAEYSGVGLTLVVDQSQNYADQRCGYRITRNLIYGCTSHGIEIAGAGALNWLVLAGNQLVNNGGYGLKGTAANHNVMENARNNYYGNTSGARNNFAAGVSDLSVDPQFVNAAGRDYTAQNSAVLGTGWPQSVGTGLSSYPDLGPLQGVAVSGGSSNARPPLVALGQTFPIY